MAEPGVLPLLVITLANHFCPFGHHGIALIWSHPKGAALHWNTMKVKLNHREEMLTKTIGYAVSSERRRGAEEKAENLLFIHLSDCVLNHSHRTDEGKSSGD